MKQNCSETLCFFSQPKAKSENIDPPREEQTESALYESHWAKLEQLSEDFAIKCK